MVPLDLWFPKAYSTDVETRVLYGERPPHRPPSPPPPPCVHLPRGVRPQRSSSSPALSSLGSHSDRLPLGPMTHATHASGGGGALGSSPPPPPPTPASASASVVAAAGGVWSGVEGSRQSSAPPGWSAPSASQQPPKPSSAGSASAGKPGCKGLQAGHMGLQARHVGLQVGHVGSQVEWGVWGCRSV